MEDKRKPREQDDSLWGEVARMEAEVNDPEEMETSVYDMRKLAELGQLPPGFSLDRHARRGAPKRLPGGASPKLPNLRSDADGEEDDATKVFEHDANNPQRQRAVAQAPVSRAHDEPLHDEDESKEPTQTKVFDRDSSSLATSQSSVVRARREPPIEVHEEPAVVAVAPSTDALAAASTRESRAESSEELAPTRASTRRRPHALRIYGPFVGLVIVGFAMGYWLVAELGLG